MGTVSVKPASQIADEAKDKIRKDLAAAVQRYADEVAQSRGYDNLLTLCTYATSSLPEFAAEGQAGVAWRDALWAKWYEISVEIEQGLRAIPTEEEAIALLPQINW